MSSRKKSTHSGAPESQGQGGGGAFGAGVELRKPLVKSHDMSDEMQKAAIVVAGEAMNCYSIEQEIADVIKQTFDVTYGPTWHCIVGRNFGSYVTHEKLAFIYFFIGQVAILLFKNS